MIPERLRKLAGKHFATSMGTTPLDPWLASAIKFDIQNVADWVADEEKRNGTVSFRNLANLFPPWPCFLAERVEQFDDGPQHLVTLVRADLAEAYMGITHITAPTGWLYQLITFSLTGATATQVPAVEMIVDVNGDPDAFPLDDPNPKRAGKVKFYVDNLPGAVPAHAPLDTDDDAGIYSASLHAAAVTLMAVAFANLRNVSIEDRPLPRAERRRLMREGGSGDTYKILKIGHVNNMLRAEGEMDSGGLKRALHICRGHIAEYGGNKGLLFGKHAGRFFIPAHLRGSKERGEVHKDYKI